MALIRANRESIDDRFSVLGFTVRTDTPLFEIGLATDPALLMAENRGRRTRGNFFSSTVLGASRRRDGESIYLVPPSVVARFAGQQRLYFGLATYQDGNRSVPVEVRIPDRGNMYVSLAGLTERGLRRSVRGDGATAYGNGAADSMQWGADAVTAPRNGAARAGNGNGHAAASPAAGEPAPYSDGYSDDLWKKPAATPAPTATPDAAAAPAPVANAAPAADVAPAAGVAPAPVAAQQGWRGPVRAQGYDAPMPARPLARPLLVGPYYQPQDWWDALTTQIAHFAKGALWFLGVPDTTKPPFSAICQVRAPDGTAEGSHMGTAFYIGPRLLLTAAHVVEGMSELIIVPGKNGGGISTQTEPFGRFHATTFATHPSYPAGGRDHDMALICVPPEHAAQGANYFNLVEELTQSRPEGVIVTGYAAKWLAVTEIEKYVNANIDHNRQHAHGGYIREIPTDGTFTYDLQTLAGTSGSPVYWIEDGAAPQAHLVGVHVAANDDRTNKGCRITQEKLRWIRDTAAAWGQTLTFSLAARALEAPTVAADDESDPEVYGISEGEPDYVESATTQSVRALAATSPDYPGASRFAPAHANNFRVGRRGNAAVDRIVIHITAGGPNINGTISWFQNGNRINARTGKPIRSSSHYVVGRDGEVVQMVRNADTAWHASAVNSRSIGIEHNANKPSRGNKRDLPPTDAQYEASARLVAWLCQQYGLPIDREHIVGHLEASPRDNHDCPSDYWDWDRYMACVQLAAAPNAIGQASYAGAQTLGAYSPGANRLTAPRPVSRGTMSRGLEIISPFYNPADPSTALSCQDDAFSLAREEWFVGVPDTSIFPHSAICQLNMTAPDGSQYGGTGFYIGRNRILTCAHNLHGMSRCEIIPGRNGAGNRPFGSTTVQSASWRVAPRYSGSGDWDNDLAVIDNVPIAAPGGAWFEFLNATPSDRLPIVVCGYSAASRKVPELDYIIDGDKQHLHGGYVSAQPTFDTIDYPILSLMGASGSPVYTLTRASGTLKAAICAVHVSGEPAPQGLNRGCFITPTKIDWIEGRATTFALGMTARGLSDQDEDDARGIEGPIPDDSARAQSLAAFGAALSAPSPEYPQASRFAPAAADNYRANSNPRPIDRVVIHITDGGPNINGTIGWFQNPSAKVSAHYVIGQDGEVVQMVRHQDVAWHAGKANRGTIGIEHVANTRGLLPTPQQMCASAALVTWLCDSYNIPVDRTHILGHSEADTGTTHTGCPNAVWDWDYYMGLVRSRSCYAPGAVWHAETLAGGTDYPVHLIPQPDKNACWAASMAMLLSFRRNQSLTPETLANDVGASLATCYNWDLLKAVRDRYGFEILRQPDNASIYHSPAQWADWLASYGPLWVVIVGAPHAVVLAGIKGNLDDPSSVKVKILNPWDTRVGFDNDPVAFNPPNQGYEDWLSFEQFASDFGNMAESNYGNWRVLHLPAAAVNAQSLGQSGYLLKRAPAAHTLGLGELPTSGESREPIEPSRVPGTRMHLLRGSAGACRWALDQLEGMKEPAVPNPIASSAAPVETTVDLSDWPALDGAVCPLPLSLVFRAQKGCVGDVRIRAGNTSHLAYGMDVTARIEDYADLSAVAVLRVTIDYRFSGLADGEPSARIQLRLLGDGRFERENGWVDSGGIPQAA